MSGGMAHHCPRNFRACLHDCDLRCDAATLLLISLVHERAIECKALTQNTGISPSRKDAGSPKSGILMSLMPSSSIASQPHATGSPCVSRKGLVMSRTLSTSSGITLHSLLDVVSVSSPPSLRRDCLADTGRSGGMSPWTRRTERYVRCCACHSRRRDRRAPSGRQIHRGLSRSFNETLPR
jgi:hypothetical protein